jgi:hypothetical protein
MNKKPSKVQETVTPYGAKKPAKAAPASKTAASGMRYVDDVAFKRVTDKIFAERKELLRKLAQ